MNGGNVGRSPGSCRPRPAAVPYVAACPRMPRCVSQRRGRLSPSEAAAVTSTTNCAVQVWRDRARTSPAIAAVGDGVLRRTASATTAGSDAAPW